MNTTALRTAVVAAGLAAAGLGVAGAAFASVPSEHAGPRTTVETQRGTVLECHGEGVQATVYENSKYGNSLVVIVGDPKALRRAIGNTTVTRRHTRLAERLRNET